MTHILIVTAHFYEDIAKELLKGAANALAKAGASFEQVSVPGAFEIPGAIGFAIAGASGRKFDGFIALGCVIRGETTHYDYVCAESARGLMDLAVQKQAAIGYGILTVETMEQAHVRADVKEGNKGEDAANACLRMIELKRQFDVTT